jgi:hypothetical protein
VTPPPALTAALKKNRKAQAGFGPGGTSAGHQWITEAKTDETRRSCAGHQWMAR